MSRWRADKGEGYWYICTNVTGTKIQPEFRYDFRHSLENAHYLSCNYFRTATDANDAIRKIQLLLGEL